MELKEKIFYDNVIDYNTYNIKGIINDYSETTDIIINSNNDNLKEYIDFFHRERPINFSLDFIKKIEKIITIEELKKVCRNYNFYNIDHKNLEYIIDCLNIYTTKEFKLLFEENIIKDILDISNNILKLIIKIYNINSLEKLKIFGEMNIMKDILFYDNKNLEFIIKYFNINTIQELEAICGSPFILNTPFLNLKLVIDIYNIDSIKKLLEVLENQQISNMLFFSREKNFELIIHNLNIDTPKKLEMLLNNSNIRSMLELIDEKLFDFFIKKMNINNLEKFKILCKYYDSLGLGILINKNLKFAINILNIDHPKKLIDLGKNKNIIHSLVTLNIPDNIIILSDNLNIDKDELANFFYKNVFKSKYSIHIIFNNKIPNLPEFQDIFSYLLKNKKKYLLTCIQKISLIYEFNLGIDITKIKKIEDFGNNKFKENFEKILEKYSNNVIKKERFKKQFNRAYDLKDKASIEKFSIENFTSYFEIVYNRKWNIKIKNEFNIKEEILDKKINDPIFIEAYKMSINPTYNKQYIKKLLLDYLHGKFDNVIELNQYNTLKNKKWLNKNLNSNQQKIWLSENKKYYNIESENKDKKEEKLLQDKEQKIQDYFEISCEKIQSLNKLGFNFKENFDNSGELQCYFNKIIKHQEKEIQEKDIFYIYEDLKTQIELIGVLKKDSNISKSTKITNLIISRELNPLRSLMMGNWCQGSCLGFYSGYTTYWSAISNTIDVNKGVYYIYDQNQKLLARCLLTIGNDKKLSRYRIYYIKDVSLDIEEYVNMYIKELANDMKIGLNGNPEKVKNIESDKWYKDMISII